MCFRIPLELNLADGPIQVVMVTPYKEQFENWLRSCGLQLFPIPVEDDLPTYGIGPRCQCWCHRDDQCSS